jgi:hypothetical protein
MNLDICDTIEGGDRDKDVSFFLAEGRVGRKNRRGKSVLLKVLGE